MRRLSGFSLMEMMIVLTIVAIVAAASAPMVNKKMVVSNNNGSIWQWDASRRSIYFNDDGANNSTRSVRIGSRNIPNNSNNARLYINSSGDAIPHISFARRGGNVMNLVAGGDRNNLWLTADSPDDGITNSVVLGVGARASNLGVSIGTNMAEVDGSDGSIIIGNNTIADSAPESVVIGRAAQVGDGAQSFGSISIGSRAIANNDRSVAIGRFAEALGNLSVAIGSSVDDSEPTRTMARGANSIALGAGARVALNAPSAIAIGNSSTIDANSDNSIVIGGSNTVARNAGNSLAIGTGCQIGNNSSDSIAIGHNARIFGGSNNSIVIGTQGDQPNVNYVSRNSIIIGTNAGPRLRANGSINNLIAIGENAGQFTVGNNKICIGSNAGPRREAPAAERINDDEIIYIGSRPRWTPQIWSDWFQDGMIVIHNGRPGFTVPGKGRRANESGPTVYINGNLCVRGYIAGVMRDDDGKDSERMAFIGGKEMGNTKGMNMHTGVHFPNQSMSDRRLKNVGKAFVGGLAELKKLDFYNYTFKDDEKKTPRVGVMAQDLQKVFPNAVLKGDDGFLRIRTEDMFYAVINAVKELDLRISSNSKKIEVLEKQNQVLLKQNAELLKRIEALEKASK